MNLMIHLGSLMPQLLNDRLVRITAISYHILVKAHCGQLE